MEVHIAITGEVDKVKFDFRNVVIMGKVSKLRFNCVLLVILLMLEVEVLGTPKPFSTTTQRDLHQYR